MTIGIIGLGLIGGSLAKAFKFNTDYTVLAYDIDEVSYKRAVLVNAVDGKLTDENISECDFLFPALYPQATLDYMNEKAHLIKPGAIVIDCCGVKEYVCPTLFSLAEKYGFNYIGGHPMAGRQFSGFRYAEVNLFRGACMILVPKKGEDISLLEKAKKCLTRAGFAHVTVTSAERHDEIIAYTSQLAHVVSNAYVKSPRAEAHKGFSAGSYKDLTRVAKLSENMWTELFLENRGNLISELDFIIDSLAEYRDALAENDEERLKDLLREGRMRKERIDEEWRELE
ncbi:MAG: prephenate dehydrogenase/arogenate dehydrogenase family protein [Oscillospiraceae bacterium]|nr:prephenate dehydrogenase/arogenate dehydrogenase family protein [Oscillospiraceae bacterium]